MTLTEDFPNSAVRSYSAAKQLQLTGDLVTSSHLYGVAVECVLKAILERAGITIDRKSKLRVHVPWLLHNILDLGHSRHMGSVAKNLSTITTCFLEYSIDTRYAGNHDVDLQRCTDWEIGARLTLQDCGFC